MDCNRQQSQATETPSIYLFFFPGRDQYYSRLFLWVCCSGSTRRLNREVDFCCCFWRSPGSNLRPLVYKARDLTTAPRRLLTHLVGGKRMLIHQVWFTALYNQHLLDSQCFEFEICILQVLNMPLIRCTNVFF